MITKEILDADALLAGLTDEQKSAVCTLSQNDENAVIAKKTGEIYGALDADILAVSGMAKNGAEKTYDYAKRVIADIKAKADGAEELQSEKKKLADEKARLEKVIADGAGDSEAAKQLRQAKADLANVSAQYAELNTRYEAAQADFDKRLVEFQVDSGIAAALSGMRFKQSIPEAARAALMEQASAKIKGMRPALVDDGNGGKALVFNGEDGAVLRNKNNQLRPYTVGELLAEQLDTLGVLDKGRRQTGAGGQGGAGGNVPPGGYKTRAEAYDAISASLMARGLAAGTQKFQEAMDAAWKEGNIKNLPEK